MPKRKLERSIGLFGVLAISISAMLGSGLFVLPGLAAAIAGPSVWLAYLFAGLCVAPAAFSKAELATAMPTSGGTYVYLERAFGPLAGTVAGLGLWLSLLLKSAFALVGFGAYLSVLADVPLKITALILLVGVLLINIVGIAAISKLQKWIVAFVLVAMVGLVVLAGLHYNPQILTPAFPHGAGGFLAAAGFVYVSYAGVTKVAAIAEEVKDPTRNLPLGILLSLLLVMGIYGTVTHMLVAVVPAAELAGDLHPIYTLADRVGGSTLGLFAAGLGIVTMTSMAIAGLLASSRFPFAMSRNKLLPEKISQLHARFHTPVVAIVLTALIMALAIVFLDVAKIAKLASGFKIMIFLAVNLTVIVLRESHTHWYKPGYRSPFYPWLQILGVVLCLGLLVVMGLTALLSILTITAVGTLFYLLYGRKRTTRIGVLGRKGVRAELVRTATQTGLPTISTDASVVVPLFGHERSPEALVEMAAVLADGRRVEVLHLTEVPEHIPMEELSIEDPRTTALRRRLAAMAEERGLDLFFEPVLSRDLGATINDVAGRVRCDWVVMASFEGDRHQMGFHNPIGWLQDHLPCNLAVFRDAGIRYVRKLMVHPLPGPHDALVMSAASQLARVWNAELNVTRWSSPRAPGAEQEAHRRYIEQIAQIATVPAQLSATLPGKSRTEAMVEATAAYDLLVMGAAANRNVLDMIVGTHVDRVTRRADCSVLWLKRPRQIAIQHHTTPDDDGFLAVEEALATHWVRARVPLTKRQLLFNKMALDFASIHGGVRPVDVVEALEERERQQSTAVGMGVAMPHGFMSTLDSTWLGVYTTETPINYGTADTEGVDVFFVSISPPSDRQGHLDLMGGLSNMSLNTDLLSNLRAAVTVDDAVAALLEANAAVTGDKKS